MTNDIVDRIEEIEKKIAAMQRACIPPVTGSGRPTVVGRVISSGGGSMTVAVVSYLPVNTQVIVAERDVMIVEEFAPSERISVTALTRPRAESHELRSVVPRVGSIWHWGADEEPRVDASGGDGRSSRE